MANGKYRVADDRDFETFNRNLKMLMDAHGYNMKQLAIALDMNITSISRYFNGRTPDTISVWRIADHFNVTIDWLLGRSQSKFDSMSPELAKIANLYAAASASDKLVVDTLLKKYDV